MHGYKPNDIDTNHSGYVAIIGRHNVGKSTLLNCLLGEKLSITSSKPQTTRHQILGIKTLGDIQFLYVDTPGLHQEEHRKMNKYMNKTARNALKDVDVIIFVVDGLKWNADDEWILKLLSYSNAPCILAVNKSDTIKNKAELLPHLEALAKKHNFAAIIPISATLAENVDVLEKKVAELLPLGPHYYPSEQITDRPIKFRIAEIIREKLTRNLGEELPYSLSVEIESLEDTEELCTIHALIWVERESQKPIVIGAKGARLKKIGIASRLDIEALLQKKVHLKLWVKVKDSWADDERALHILGYLDE